MYGASPCILAFAMAYGPLKRSSCTFCLSSERILLNVTVGLGVVNDAVVHFSTSSWSWSCSCSCCCTPTMPLMLACLDFYGVYRWDNFELHTNTSARIFSSARSTIANVVILVHLLPSVAATLAKNCYWAFPVANWAIFKRLYCVALIGTSVCLVLFGHIPKLKCRACC